MDNDERARSDDTLFESPSTEAAAPGPALTDEARERMERRRADVSNRVGGASGEIERLRMKQEQLEREKQELQALAKKQAAYESGKRDVLEKLTGSFQLLEKEREQAVRMAELLDETRRRFAEHIETLERIREENWPDNRFKEELDAALVSVDAARTVYQKALARIEASRWHRGGGGRVAELAPTTAEGAAWPRGFGFWLKAGLAFGLPLIFVLIMLFLASLYTSGYFSAF